MQKQKVQQYFDPFLPETLEKQFIKRDSKFKFSNEEEISSNIEGFINYFSAPNIRHKVKHPLFLTMKFSSCISLWANSNIFSQISNDEKTIEAIQKVLFETYLQSRQGPLKMEQKPLLLVVDSLNALGQSQQKQRKVLEFLEPMKSDIIEIILDPVSIPKCFKKIDNSVKNIEKLNNLLGRSSNQLSKSIWQVAESEVSNHQQHLEFYTKFRLLQKNGFRRQEMDVINFQEEYRDRIRKIIQIQGPEMKTAHNDFKKTSEPIKQVANSSMNAEVQLTFKENPLKEDIMAFQVKTEIDKMDAMKLRIKKELEIPLIKKEAEKKAKQAQQQQMQQKQLKINSMIQNQVEQMNTINTRGYQPQAQPQMNPLTSQNQMMQLAYQQWIASQMSNQFLYQNLMSHMQQQQQQQHNQQLPSK